MVDSTAGSTAGKAILDFRQGGIEVLSKADMELELSEEEKKVKNDFEAACRKLNMDQDSMEAAWASYDKIKDHYTLEVR